jgi:hypothetical protein
MKTVVLLRLVVLAPDQETILRGKKVRLYDMNHVLD